MNAPSNSTYFCKVTVSQLASVVFPDPTRRYTGQVNLYMNKYRPHSSTYQCNISGTANSKECFTRDFSRTSRGGFHMGIPDDMDLLIKIVQFSYLSEESYPVSVRYVVNSSVARNVALSGCQRKSGSSTATRFLRSLQGYA
jgi:hypothetical protein